jgi:hypothetical protein
MSFVELDRDFVQIGKDQEATLDVGRLWGRKAGGWLAWPEILKHQRVVLLAEASSGKSEEFRNQTNKLLAAGQPAFFVRIEELADQGFEAALEPGNAKTFERWRDTSGEGWFFLDSVDEARLNRKSFETALKRFARDLDRAAERARVFISCRMSDWRSREDRALIERLLPAWEQPQTPGGNDNSNPLLDPIFNEKQDSKTRPRPQLERKPNELLVLQLVPLSTDQCRTLAAHLGVHNVGSFSTSITQNGLDAFTERPGDVIDLVDYWKSYGRFGPFAAMVEHSIDRKLSEVDNYRPDNEMLPPQRAREGAERIAAALTFGKSFTLRAPGYDLDSSLVAGAVDPAVILDDWSPAERNTLLRRGVFAPSTYSRIRFHHRSTQEYLTARWFDRLLKSNCPRSELWNLIFVTRYGVETIVPSLRPVAAWLALWHPDFLEETIRREPLVLLRHGDAGSLSIEARSKLLTTYAEKHSRAEIADDSLDNRALWMFADQGLGDTVRRAWSTNRRPDFRMDLLRLIRDGAIKDCVDLARSEALDRSAGDYHRIVALQALQACGDREGLSAIARDLMDTSANVSPRLASEFAKTLYPNNITIKELFTIIEGVRPPKRHSSEGFGRSIAELFDASPDAESRREFAARLADLCLTPPYAEPFQRIARRHLEIAKHVERIAILEVKALGDHDPAEHLIRLLMVVERAEREPRLDDNGPQLSALVRANQKLQRALFWSDVQEHRSNSGDSQELIRFWQIHFYGPTLWQFGERDLPWLHDDLSNRAGESDQRLVLSAIGAILRQTGRIEAETPHLKKLIEDRPFLKEDLQEYLAPSRESSAEIRYKRETEQHRRKSIEQEDKAKASWVKFGNDVRHNPVLLRDPQVIRSWKLGAWRLWTLTNWLVHRTKVHDEEAPKQWRLLKEGFGAEVAEAYRDGLKLQWRLTRPLRPKRSRGGSIKYVNILAFGAVGVEAASDPDWTSHLSDDEAKMAALHGCWAERGFPEWIEVLVASHPRVVLPVLRRRIREEWLSPTPGSWDFIYWYSQINIPIHSTIQQILFEVISSIDPPEDGRLGRMLGIVQRLALTQKQKFKLFRIGKARLADHAGARRNGQALHYLALLLLLDMERALPELECWLAQIDAQDRQARAETTFSFLFDLHNPLIPGALAVASVPDLARLLRLVYFYVRPEADVFHEGSYTPGTREHAEGARNFILTAMLNRPGADAYYALRRMADDPEYALRADRFCELARGKAERDTEPPAWTARETVVFEREHTAPVKAGVDLLRVVESVLKDIQFQLDKMDVSSRTLLQRAADEDEVQNWIVEQMNYRSRGRFIAHREAEVADGDMPDVIISSTSAPCEVAIEIKHGGKKWTVRQLEHALRSQLATDYLKPPSRRHGVLVITHHGQRQWRDPESNEVVTFEGLILLLASVAKTLVNNEAGAIEVRCFGIDASPRQTPIMRVA